MEELIIYLPSRSWRKYNDTTTPRFGELHFSLMSAPVTNPVVKLGVGPPARAGRPHLVSPEAARLGDQGARRRRPTRPSARARTTTRCWRSSTREPAAPRPRSPTRSATTAAGSSACSTSSRRQASSSASATRSTVAGTSSASSRPGKKRLAELREISRSVEDEFFAPLDAKERERAARPPARARSASRPALRVGRRRPLGLTPDTLDSARGQGPARVDRASRA